MMIKKKIMLVGFVTALSIGVAGCMSVSEGNKSIANVTHQTINQKLVRGKTTESQVRTEFGDPAKVSFQNNGNDTVWKYSYSKGRTGPLAAFGIMNIKGRQKTLLIIFDKKGVLKNYSFSSSAMQQHVGAG